jgi:hypothetical protein
MAILKQRLCPAEAGLAADSSRVAEPGHHHVCSGVCLQPDESRISAPRGLCQPDDSNFGRLFGRLPDSGQFGGLLPTLLEPGRGEVASYVNRVC